MSQGFKTKQARYVPELPSQKDVLKLDDIILLNLLTGKCFAKIPITFSLFFYLIDSFFFAFKYFLCILMI